MLRRSRLRTVASLALCTLLAPLLHAVSVHGTVKDPAGRPLEGIVVALLQGGTVITSARTGGDGTFELTSSAHGQFTVLAGGISFRQVLARTFYGGTFDSVNQDIILEPEWVRESIVTTPAGIPQSQGQVSNAVTTIEKSAFTNRFDLIDPLRQVPGFQVIQNGQRGGETSIYVRGGNADANKVLLDGAPIEDIGGHFDLSAIPSTGIASVEAYRGPDSVLWGSDAASGVVAFTTPRGTTTFPSLLYEGDGGGFGTYRNEVQLGGAFTRLDYYGAYANLQTGNSLPMDQHHNITEVVNLGYQYSGSTAIRLIARSGNVATGQPGTYSFFGMSNDGKQADQDIFMTGTIDHTFSDTSQGTVRYGMARAREQSQQWYPAGDYIEGNYYGKQVTIGGENGYTASGRALMNYGGVGAHTTNLDSNRDNLDAQLNFGLGSHLNGVAGFRYEDERGMENKLSYGISQTLERANYDYRLMLNGDLAHQRIRYSFGGGVQKNQLYGTQGSPSAGAVWYPFLPGAGMVQGTRLSFQYSQGVKEPSLDDQFGSLQQFLLENGGWSTVQKYGISAIGAEQSRSYEGGVEQYLFNEHILLRATYFHNQFGRQIEYVGANLVPSLLPQLSAAQQQSLEGYLESESAQALTVNSGAYRAQGVETEADYGIGKNIFMRGGYTYLDARVQRSFTSDAVGPSVNPNIPGVLIGNDAPLVGARPFRRPPHTGFASVSYTRGKVTMFATGVFASASDDSTYLGGKDLFGTNTLLLPNRNLDPGYSKLDVSATYKMSQRMDFYMQSDNLLSQQYIAPIGYLSLPASYRVGVRIALGHPKTNP
ncbi:TonB-dependent receptor [Silvibacterium dinghuense]|uniref:TonB-dependent receptor n=1 Tax=Silvibacterium dinghuense TaxID=1560006 RepID=A0A4Q1SHM0_9BACT|nr:TonB-dependent receptor [Silvibacterium dinghuense]RXS96670.1 TonB-dependent receptor [Silvibacterium dinghuense]GGG92700.1 TonB-dependent receptor [Silvibacterium dinghuense]